MRTAGASSLRWWPSCSRSVARSWAVRPASVPTARWARRAWIFERAVTGVRHGEAQNRRGGGLGGRCCGGRGGGGGGGRRAAPPPPGGGPPRGGGRLWGGGGRGGFGGGG